MHLERHHPLSQLEWHRLPACGRQVNTGKMPVPLSLVVTAAHRLSAKPLEEPKILNVGEKFALKEWESEALS